MSVAVSTVNTLPEYAEALQAVAEQALADTDAGLPEMSYISTWPPAYDCCPALIVTVPALREAQTSPNVPVEEPARRVSFAQLILATYTVTVLRCAAPMGANGRLPDPAAMTEVALATQSDVWALWNGIASAIRDGIIFDRCLGVHFDGGNPIREQGGCVGWEFTVRADIPGFDMAISPGS